ncbi:hypothetical protein ACHAWF_001301 [Thalassiosira exigua]
MGDQASSAELVPTPLASHAINRSKGLSKLGVSEDEVQLAEKLLGQIPACPSDPNKAERVLGYASSRLAREKALRLLGASEEEVDVENSKILGSMGIAGRRRSFSVAHSSQSDVLAFAKALPRARRRHTIGLMKRHVRRMVKIDKRRRRRSSESELMRLRAQAKEIEELRSKVNDLESRLSFAKAAVASSNEDAGTPKRSK